MFESVFGLYIDLIAATRASYGHDRDVLTIMKMAQNFRTIMGPKKKELIPT